MNREELAEHLAADHSFDVPSHVVGDFLRDLHHGLHVEGGRGGTEDHLHEVRRSG